MHKNNRVRIMIIVAVPTILLGVFLVQSRFFGTRATAADYFPKGFVGELVDAPASASFQVLEHRDDGTPVFTADVIRFTDAIDGFVEMPRPAVSLAEADRLGHPDNIRTPAALSAYCMRGPVSVGFTDTDGQWIAEVATRHEDPKMQAKAVTMIAFAFVHGVEYNNNSFTNETRQRLVDTYRDALLSADPAVQQSAVAMSDWDHWAKEIPDFTELLRKVASSDNPNAERAAYALEQAFGIRLDTKDPG